MRYLGLWSLTFLLVLSARAENATAQANHVVYLSEYLDNDLYTCWRMCDSIPTTREIYVLVSSSGTSAVQFSAPLPTCLIGASYISDTTVFPVTLGNSQTGVAIGLGGCATRSATHVLTINCMLQGLTEGCCPYQVMPHPGDSESYITFTDCEFRLVEGRSGMLLISPYETSPVLTDRSPPDGAVNQPLDTKLDCTVFRCDCTCCALLLDVYFGIDPNPPRVAIDTWVPYDPGALEPETTYYWKLVAYGAGEVTTPVWTFTTEELGVPVKPTSWGSIKALYEE